MATGIFARAALINSIYKRGVNLTGKARTTMTNAALVNFISTDASSSLLHVFMILILGIGQSSRRLCSVVCECLHANICLR